MWTSNGSLHSHTMAAESHSGRATRIAAAVGGVGLFAGAFLLLTTAFSVYRLNQGAPVSVDPGAWSWLGQVQVQVESGSDAYGPFLSEGNLDEVVIARTPVTSKPLVAKAKKTRSLKRVFARKRLAPQAVEPLRVEPPKASTTTVAVASPSPERSSDAEMTTLQNLHGLLRRHLVLALTTQPAMVQTLIATMSPTAASSETPQKVVLAPHARKKTHRLTHVRRAKPVEQEAPAVVIHEAKEVRKEIAPPAVAEVPVEAPALIAQAQISPDLNTHASDRIESSQSAQIQVEVPVVAEAPAVSAAEARKFELPPAAPAAAITTRENPPAEEQLEFRKPIQVAGLVISRPHAAPVSVAAAQVEYSAPVSPVSTHEKNGYSSAGQKSESAEVGVMSQAVTEAFDWITSVSGGAAHALTQESRDQGWVLAEAQGHWPTLARKQSTPIPLISKNTGRLLSTLSNASLQMEAGIVFGKVPAGWSVRLSGRSERPVFLNAQNQSISAAMLEGERYFAFLNAAPGSHLLSLTNSIGVEEGAVGIAILGGTATFVDFSSVKKVTVSGRVLDGSDAQTRAMPHVSVRALGAANARAETRENGTFTIENVMTVSDYPIYLETDTAEGYTHRYQIRPSQAKAATLYRLSPAAIQTYLNQLEGTVSPESGVIIAALPNTIAAQGAQAKLIPSVRPIGPSPTLQPEIYTLSASGQMQPAFRAPMNGQATRFVSVQVPEGPAIATLSDHQDKPVWSEMLMVSPAVIHLIGPN